MKRTAALILSLVLLLSVMGVRAEGEEPLFKQMAALEWLFCSGAGGWAADLWILEDGSFRGEYHALDMNDAGEGYPLGTVYICDFTGRMTLLEQADERSWKILIEKMAFDDELGLETIIEEGYRCITTDFYGITEGDEMTLYLPGTPVDALSDDMRMWAHLYDMENAPSELENWMLCSEKNDSGFVGYPIFDGAAEENP